MIMKQQVKNKQIKRKQACFLCFVNAFKFQEKSLILFKEFLGNKNNINKKRFLEKTTCHNGHYMINMGSQRSKIGSN